MTDRRLHLHTLHQLTKLRGQRIARVSHSMGTIIAIGFAPLHRTRRWMGRSGRFFGGHEIGRNSIFAPVDWTLRFGSYEMHAMPEERHWRMRKWLQRLVGRRLLRTHLDENGDLTLDFEGNACLDIFRDHDGDAGWAVIWRPHPFEWSDGYSPFCLERSRGLV